MGATGRWGLAVGGSGIAAVGVTIALWSVPVAAGDVWTVVALAALRSLAVIIVGGLALVAVLARRGRGADSRSTGQAPEAVVDEIPA